MNKISGKKYLKIVFKLASPLMIGCGKNENTDNDINTDSAGNPYIPGTAIAGAVRDLAAQSGDISSDIQKEIFGDVMINDTAGDMEDSAKESRILFYDANLIKEDLSKYNISVRDSVALDEYKTAKDGAKFDMEILEPGVSFETYIELNAGANEEYEKKVWEAVKAAWLSGDLSFGGKTTRGMGVIEVTSIHDADFDFSQKQSVEDWLTFDMYADSSKWNPVKDKAASESSSLHIDLSLELISGISIRQYFTEPDAPDYSQLTVKDTGKEGSEIPVIPGTTWAGAFRHRITELLECAGNSRDDAKRIAAEFFGDVDTSGDDNKTKSRIIFSESQITGSTPKVVTRNAIDRFTGGAADGALYTEKMYYGGETGLEIKIKNIGSLKKSDHFEAFKNALAAAIADLHGGYLAIGGLTAVGRGIFKIKTIGDDSEGAEDQNAEAIYSKIVKYISDREKEVG